MEPDRLDLDALEAVARGASGSDWHVITDAAHPANRRITSRERRHIAKVYGTHLGDETDGVANATHIATFDPPTVLALISALRRASVTADGYRMERDHLNDEARSGE